MRLHRLLSLTLLAALIAALAPVGRADYLEVRHTGPLRAEPSSGAERLATFEPGTALALLDDGAQHNGYYHVVTGSGAVGWFFRTLARRFEGEAPFSLEPPRSTADLPFFEPDWPPDQVPEWVLRSKHLIYGMPRPTGGGHLLTVGGSTVPGVSVLVREGFVVGHLDRLKVPLWVSLRWTREDLAASRAAPTFPRPFSPDDELPPYARAADSYDGQATGYDRGHMARHEDNAAWGRDNSDVGCLMSNVVPQEIGLNRGPWLQLENLHHEAVEDPVPGVDVLWVITGPLFEDGEPELLIANEVGVPRATYKIIAWFDREGRFQARGYVLEQDDRGGPVERYLTSIRSIETRVGLDFFPYLADAVEEPLELAEPVTVW